MEADSESHHLSHDPRHEALHRRSPSAKVVHRTILVEGREELERPSAALAWSGLAAGLSMGFSLVAEGLLRAKLPEASWTPLITSLGYSVGFLFIVLGRQQLFTETTLTAVLPALQERTARIVMDMLRVWSVVLLMNLIGAFIFAAVAAKTNIFAPDVRHAFALIGEESIRHSFLDDLLKGIAGGWLIALMAWMLPASETARFWTIIVTTYLIALGELTHVIAGSVDTLYLVWEGKLGFGAYVMSYLVPVLIGNTIGGVAFVAALNHAQSTAGEK